MQSFSGNKKKKDAHNFLSFRILYEKLPLKSDLNLLSQKYVFSYALFFINIFFPTPYFQNNDFFGNHIEHSSENKG